MLKLRFLILYILFSSITLSAQNKHIVYGKITDQNGNPLELVSIAIKNTITGTTTDSNGNYELKVPVNKRITLVFSRLGSEKKEVEIATYQPKKKFNLKLKQATTDLSEVKVRESRFETGTMERIDSKMTKNLPTASGNAVEALVMTQMGVRSNNELSSQYSVRGGNFDENLVYVNGIEVYRPFLIRSGQQEGLSFINPSLVSSISFSAGGFESKYGDKMSSVLDITYRRPTDFAASVETSMLGAQVHAESNNLDGKFTQIHGFRYKTNSYLLGSLDTKGEYNPTFFDYQTYLTYRINDKVDIGFLGNFSQNRYQFRPESRETQFGTFNIARSLKVYFDGWESDIFRTAMGALNLNYRADDKNAYTLNLSAFNTNEQEKMDIAGEYWINELDTRLGSSTVGDSIQNIGVGGYLEHARNQLKVNVASLEVKGGHEVNNHLIQWGAKFQSEMINDKIRTWHMRDSSGHSLPYRAYNDSVDLYFSLRSNIQKSLFRTNLFVQDSYIAKNGWGTFNLTGGFRLSHWSFNNEVLFSPRFSALISPKWEKDYRFRLAAGVYHQAPFYKELRNFGNRITYFMDSNNELKALPKTSLTGELNENIKSQRSIQLLGGIDYYFKKWERPFKFSTELYYKKLDNLIPYDVDNVSIRYYGENMSEGYSTGMDMRLYGEFVPGIDSWITLSYMKTEENVTYPLYNSTGDRIGNFSTGYVARPTDQRFNVSMFFQDYFPGNPNLQLNLQMIIGSPLPAGPPNGRKDMMKFKYPPYFRADIGLSRRFIGTTANKKRLFKEAWISTEVLNLFNINNVNSYFWVQDIYGNMFAVPNYLTARRFNLKLRATF